MNQSVLITGANSGIGLAALHRFASEGWTVIAAVRSESRASQLEEIMVAAGISAKTVCFELTDRIATDAAIAQLLKYNIPDVIVNCAGVGPFGPLETTDDASIDHTLETNLVAPIRIVRAFLPHFRVRGSGAIVNVSSGLGFASDVGQGIYSASKFALEAVSEALYYELRPHNIRVAVVEPGLTNTPIREKNAPPASFGPDSPYWDTINRRLEQLSSSIYKGGWIEDAKVVADAIFDAATATAAPLFIPVGRDTQLSAKLRGRDMLDTYEARSAVALAELAAAKVA